ncbi:hypothetical protein FA15DRAFT_710931 [Coprinopsis marcescibilis]|uniref:Uncharacterized protein n=1 Tax=Coprinopsis marcescibilis TaxID=230819 RepID=A0A5C3KBL1_COPMA|nr:hypothetical protein FA15DRAFT_710931 [Coprinopsis marcescibilis]
MPRKKGKKVLVQRDRARQQTPVSDQIPNEFRPSETVNRREQGQESPEGPGPSAAIGAVESPYPLPRLLPSFLPKKYPDHNLSKYTDELSRALHMRDSAVKPMPVDQLHELKDTIVKHLVSNGSAYAIPAKFSYASAFLSNTLDMNSGNFEYVYTHFGVTAPARRAKVEKTIRHAIRTFRKALGWGDQRLPEKRMLWEHGHCAEAQSLPAVVKHCDDLGFQRSAVVIHTLAMDRYGTQCYMCENCKQLVTERILSEHPAWIVVDVSVPDNWKVYRGSASQNVQS